MKRLKILVLGLIFGIVMKNNTAIVNADADGNDCTIGIFANSTYKGTGSPVTSNINSATDIANSLSKQFGSGQAKKMVSRC